MKTFMNFANTPAGDFILGLALAIITIPAAIWLVWIMWVIS